MQLEPRPQGAPLGCKDSQIHANTGTHMQAASGHDLRQWGQKPQVKGRA